MRARILAFLGILVFLFVLLGAVQAGYADAVTTANNETEVVNETFTVDQGTAVELNDSNRNVVYDNETRVQFNDTAIEQPGNYTWNNQTGVVTVVSGSTLTDGATVGITYNYTVPNSEQVLTRDLALFFTEDWGELWPLAAGLIMLLGGVGVLGRAVS